MSESESKRRQIFQAFEETSRFCGPPLAMMFEKGWYVRTPWGLATCHDTAGVEALLKEVREEEEKMMTKGKTDAELIFGANGLRKLPCGFYYRVNATREPVVEVWLGARINDDHPVCDEVLKLTRADLEVMATHLGRIELAASLGSMLKGMGFKRVPEEQTQPPEQGQES